jgi:5-methylcytosine-specific restriction endonuclease McrA
MYYCQTCNIEKPKAEMIPTGVYALRKCRECGKIEAKRKKREWVLANTHKLQAYYQKNKEHLIKVNNIRKNKYRQQNREDYLKKNHQYYLDNKEKILAKNKKYRDENKGAKNALTAKRRALKKKATPAWLTEFDYNYIKHVYIQARALTDLTKEVHEVDHIIPLQSNLVCGLHVPWNLQILTKSENSSKGNRINLPPDLT